MPQLPTNSNQRAVNMLEGLRSFIINNPKAQSTIAGLGSAATGYIGTQVANSFIPDQYDIDPLAVAAGAGVYGAFKGRGLVNRAVARNYGNQLNIPGI